ncbi:MAG: sodium:solute symporter family protein, partial [Planctomycetota bacterium]|nr:sodium:solute symporter family protein [Planctomycetota bacterium]
MTFSPLAFALYGLTGADLLMILAYFAALLYIGFWSMKHVRDREGFFLGSRQFGKLIQTFAAFGQATSVGAVIGVISPTIKNGASGIWMNLSWGLFSMPIFWMTSVWYRRMRLLTLADFFEERYGSKAMAGFFAVVQALFFMMTAAMGLVAMSKTVAAISAKPAAELTVQEKSQYDTAVELQTLEQKDYKALSAAEQDRIKEIRKLNPRKEFSYVDENVLIAVTAMVVLLYTVAGGLEAAFLTDLIQGCFIIILTFILIPFAMVHINQANGTAGILGVFQTMHAKLPESFFELWGSPKLVDFTWYWIAAFTVLSAMNVAVQANQLTSTGSAKDEYTARYGFVTGIFMKRYAMIIMGLVAMMCLVIYGDSIRDPDYVWGRATRDLLSPAGLGLVGLMIACLMAALMSMASMLMLTTAAILTNSVYRPLFPGKSEQHYVWVGRAFSVFYLVSGVLIATKFTSIFDLVVFQGTFNCILAASFWFGILWGVIGGVLL